MFLNRLRRRLCKLLAQRSALLEELEMYRQMSVAEEFGLRCLIRRGARLDLVLFSAPAQLSMQAKQALLQLKVLRSEIKALISAIRRRQT